MPAIHANARTTPAVRAEIARSREPTGVLAQRSASQPRPSASGASAGLTRARTAPAARTSCPWTASEEERAIVCALRRATGFPLDDLTEPCRASRRHFGLGHAARAGTSICV